MSRAAPVFATLAEAAKTEPALAILQNRLRAERLENMRLIARALVCLTPLRITQAQAAESLWTLCSPELNMLLTGAPVDSRPVHGLAARQPGTALIPERAGLTSRRIPAYS